MFTISQQTLYDILGFTVLVIIMMDIAFCSNVYIVNYKRYYKFLSRLADIKVLDYELLECITCSNLPNRCKYEFTSKNHDSKLLVYCDIHDCTLSVYLDGKLITVYKFNKFYSGIFKRTIAKDLHTDIQKFADV